MNEVNPFERNPRRYQNGNKPGYKGNGHGVVSLINPVHRQNLIDAWERRRSIVLECVHCGWIGNGRQIGAYRRYHGDRCKEKLPDPVGPLEGEKQ
jgi:hypothetical protein